MANLGHHLSQRLTQLALALDVDPIDEGQQVELLDAARDVAHGIERKVTPLAAYLVGTAVGRRFATRRRGCGGPRSGSAGAP